MAWLKIGYWNIYNVHKDGVAKTEDDVVHKIIDYHDIFCLSELHCAEKDVPEIEGYGCYKVCRQKSKINRYFGGLAVYYKQYLRAGIKFIKSEIDYLWIKCDRTFFNLSKDMYICMVYIPPEYDSYYKNRGIDSVGLLEEDIQTFGQSGNYLLMGDFNSRTGEVLDYVQHDGLGGLMILGMKLIIFL